MPVPQDLMQKIEDYQKKGYAPDEIVSGLAESANYKEVASKVRFYQAKGYRPDEILDGMRESFAGQINEEHPISGTLDYSGKTAKVPEWAAKNPELYGATGAAWELAKPNIEVGGMVAGGLIGAPVGPAGAVEGGALGYGTGKRLTKTGDVLLGNQPPETATEAFTQTGKDVVEGAAIEAGGQIIGKAIPVVAKETAKQAKKLIPKNVSEKLYQSSLKMSTTLPKEERAARTATGLREGIMPTEKGLEKLEGLKKEVFKQVDDVIKEGAKKGQTIKTEDVLKRLEAVKTKFGETATPNANLYGHHGIEHIADDFKSHGETITIDKAQRIKQNIYQILKESAYGELKGPEKEAQKAIARGIKEELEGLYPELKGLNKKASEFIKLEDSLERAVGRINNRDIIGLGEQVTAAAGGAIGGTPGAVTASLTQKILGLPRVKARLAIALHKSGASQAAAISKKANNPATKKLLQDVFSMKATAILKSSISDNDKERFLINLYETEKTKK